MVKRFKKVMQIEEQNSAFKIYDFLRVTLKARLSPTDVNVSLPLIHVLIERAVDSDIYISTCLEFSQSQEGDTPQYATIQLCFTMFEYFFTILADKDKGREYLHEEVKKPYNNHLWDKIRGYLLEGYEDNLCFMEMNLQDEKDNKKFKELQSKLIKKSRSNQKGQLQDQETIKELKKELEEKDKSIERMEKLFDKEKK